MKKLIALIPVLFVFYCAKSQSYTVPRQLPYKDSRWVENTGVAGASYLNDSVVMFRNLGDTQMKPLYPAWGYFQGLNGDSTFWVWDMVRWKKLTGSGGGGTNNTNLGSAYRWLNETSQGIKTANNGFGIDIDSLTTGELTFTADTAQIPTRYTIDSLGDLISGGINNTNLGSAYRWLNETTQGIKTVTNGFGIGIDSLISGELRISTDTSQIPTRYTIDSLGDLIGVSGVTSVATNDATGIHGGTITSTGTLFIDTFHITTREWLYKVIDSLPIGGGTITANNGLTMSTATNVQLGGTLIKNTTIDGTGFNFAIQHPDTLTLSADGKTVLEGLLGVNVTSNDSINILSGDYILSKGVTAKYLAGTTAGWGYGSASSVSLGFNADASGVYGVGLAFTSDARYKPLVIDTAGSHKIGWRKIDLTKDVTGVLPVTNGGTGQSSYTDGQLLIGNSATGGLSVNTLTAGSGISVTNGNGTITIAASGGGGITSLAPIGSSPNANGATITGSVLNLEPANASFGGVVTTTTQTFAGDKTLTGNTYTTGTLQTNATSLSSNLYIPSSSDAVNINDSRYNVPTTSAGTDFRAEIGGGVTNHTLTVNATYATVIIPTSNITEAASGSHNQIDGLFINGPVVTNGTATTTRIAGLHIATVSALAGTTVSGIYNPGNANNTLSTQLSTNANTVTSAITTSTGAGTFGAGGTNVNIYANQIATNTTNNVLNINSVTTASATSGTQTVVAVQGNVLNQANGTAAASNYIGFRSDLQNNGSGTVTNLIGYDANVIIGSGATAATAGTISNYYGFKANGVAVGDSTTITNFTQYYADSVIQFWRITNPIYGFYQKGTYMKNFFAGVLNIGYNGSATTPDASAILQLNSTTQGFLPPRMTATQASAISSPAEGLMIYVTNTNGTFTAKGWWGWDGAAWNKLN